MTLDEYDPEEALLEINHKLSNVSIFKIQEHGGYVDKESLSTIKYLLYSTDTEQIKQSIRLLRKYLTQGHSDEAYVNDLLSLDILPRIKELIESDYDSAIKFECAWIVTNIAAGTASQTDKIVEAGFVDLLLATINDKNSDFDVKAQAAWALGNIAGESAHYREQLMMIGFTHAVVTLLMAVYDKLYDDALNNIYNRDDGDGRRGRDGSLKLYIPDDNTYSNIEALLWSLSNMSRGGFRTADYYQSYLPMFHIFSKYISLDYPKLQVEVCWGLSRILYNMHEVNYFHNHTTISEELCNHLCKLISEGMSKVVTPAIRTVVNITSGPNSSIIGLLKSPILTSITRLLQPDAPHELRKDAYLVISNMAAGNEETIQSVIQHKVVMINVIAHITVPGHTFTVNPIQWTPPVSTSPNYSASDEWKVTKEALWIVFNLMTTGSDNSVWILLKEHPNLTGNLVNLLYYKDLPHDICEKDMESIICLVQRSNKWAAEKFTDGKNPFVYQLLEFGILQALNDINQRQQLQQQQQQQQYEQQQQQESTSSKLERLLEASCQDVAQTNKIVDSMVNAFGLPTTLEIKSKSNKRRIIRGMEDGDVRLIENAVGNLCI